MNLNNSEHILEKCYEKAIECLKKCSTPYGFFASGGINGYNAVWSRDSMITSLGASLVNKDFKEVFRSSILTLAEHQSQNGQIPNCVDKWSDRQPHVDFKTIDSTLWFIIGNYVYSQRYHDNNLLISNKHIIEKAHNWLKCQDSGETGMLTQLPTSDWQDAFPHRYGYTINTQALYNQVLNYIQDFESLEKLNYLVNKNKDDCLWNGKYYYSFRWKNHGKYQEKSDWFDSLGNLLAILFDLADKEQTDNILRYIKIKNIATPSSIRDIYPPITKKSNHWQDYYLDCAAGNPNQYSNGGIWGYIGCFYVLCLIKNKDFKQANDSLIKIAEANLKWGFPEWIHPIKKSVQNLDKLQAWEAGMYILAYKSLKEKKSFIMRV